MVRQFCMFLAIIIVFTSCGGGGSSEGKFDASGKKVFRYNQAEGLTSLDPAFARNQANIWATTQIYNALFELNNELFIVPGLADTWEISEDGLTYTFNLHQGVRFHDSDVFEDGVGRELVAEDFVYSFKRIVDPATASTGAWIFNDKVKKNEDGSIADDWITAVDSHTLQIVLQEPFAPFLDILTMPYTYVVAKEAVEKYGDNFGQNPVGTGAFQFKSWDRQNSLILLKNEHYFKKDEEHNALPYLDAVKVSFISDKNQELLTFQNGDLDFVSGIQSNSADQILNSDGTPTAEFAANFNVEKVPYMNTEYIGINLDPGVYEGDHPFLNKKFRQAMNYAINREEMVSTKLNNLGYPGTAGIIPKALHAHDEEEVPGYTYDPAKAQELLKESGFGPGGTAIPEITLYTTSQYEDLMVYLQKQWEEIGIKVSVQKSDAAAHQEMVANGSAKLFRASWLGDYPDEENYFSLFFSEHFSPAGPNKTRFKNDEFDKLYKESRGIPDGFERIDHYRNMDRIIVEEAPVIVLYYDEVIRMTQKNVTGLQPDAMNLLKLERADIAAEEAEEATEATASAEGQ